MFANLHAIPAGKSLYTLYVSNEPPSITAECDEVDVIAPRMSSASEVVAQAAEELRADYPGAQCIGVTDQSAGTVIYDATEETEGIRW